MSIRKNNIHPNINLPCYFTSAVPLTASGQRQFLPHIEEIRIGDPVGVAERLHMLIVTVDLLADNA